MAKKTCDPLYQQALLFDEGPQGKVLQVSVDRADSQVLEDIFSLKIFKMYAFKIAYLPICLFFKIFIFILMYMSVLPACMSVHPCHALPMEV